MYSLKYSTQRIKHYLRSNSRHGTHSPFVYKLADEVIYIDRVQRHRNTAKRKEAMLAELIAYFGEYRLTAYRIGQGKTDLLDIDWCDISDIASGEELNLSKFQENDILILDKIYADIDMQKIWGVIKCDSRVTVSIDLFHFGIISFRCGQRKEDFSLRF